ncbi:hypothetical protein DFR75_102707 [Nocardia ignorata]|uniref:PknH-like protein n=1 Tax=Nocardia ignorata TaxID=145285 RepID=A0A4V3CPZ8_NOCIG|nr:hypothetical protein DFR75_102707 [Nocardia ignorata]
MRPGESRGDVVRRDRMVRWVAVLGVGVALAGCAAEEAPGIVALKSLPRLAEYPAGYSLVGKPASITAAEAGTALPLTFTDEACRPLIENPIGAGARESVASNTSPAVFLVQIVESDSDVAGLTGLVQRCANVEARTGDRTLKMAVSTVEAPKTVATEAVVVRTNGNQETRVQGGPPVQTPVAQQRVVAKVGKYVVSALVMLSSMPEHSQTAELEVLRRVYEIAVDQLARETA